MKSQGHLLVHYGKIPAFQLMKLQFRELQWPFKDHVTVLSPIQPRRGGVLCTPLTRASARCSLEVGTLSMHSLQERDACLLPGWTSKGAYILPVLYHSWGYRRAAETSTKYTWNQKSPQLSHWGSSGLHLQAALGDQGTKCI